MEGNRAPEDDFAAFYRHEYVTAARLAGLLTGSNLVNEDLAQDAFLAVRDVFSTLEQPKAYLRQALVNRCRQWHRNNERHQRRLRVLRPGAGDRSQLDADELGDIIVGLPYRQRVVVVARYWAGWTEAEIADVLGCRPGTVKSLASRALSSIRSQIEEHES